MHTIYWIGLVQACFSAMLMWQKNKRSEADVLLAFWLFVIAIDMAISLLNISFLTQLPDIIILPLLYGPFLLAYTKIMTGKQVPSLREYLLHFVPFLIFVILSILWPTNIAFEQRSFNNFDACAWLITVNHLIFIASMLFYWFLSIKLINQHTKHLSANFSYDNNMLRLTWLRFVSWLILGSFVLSAVVFLAFNALQIYPFNPIYIYHVGFLLFIFSISYYGINQTTLYKNKSKEQKNELPVADAYDEVFAKLLEDFMQTQKPYLNSELTIQDLAEKLDVPVSKISFHLNHCLSKNFYCFVNEYRVEEAKRLIGLNNNRLTLECIGYDAGFNSKSTFNALFKKQTGYTPSAWRKQQAI